MKMLSAELSKHVFIALAPVHATVEWISVPVLKKSGPAIEINSVGYIIYYLHTVLKNHTQYF